MFDEFWSSFATAVPRSIFHLNSFSSASVLMKEEIYFFNENRPLPIPHSSAYSYRRTPNFESRLTPLERACRDKQMQDNGIHCAFLIDSTSSVSHVCRIFPEPEQTYNTPDPIDKRASTRIEAIDFGIRNFGYNINRNTSHLLDFGACEERLPVTAQPQLTHALL